MKTSSKFLGFRWKPSLDLAVVPFSWVLVVGSIYAATYFIGQELWGGIGYFLFYAFLGAFVFGVGLPLLWMVVIRKRLLADLGITAQHWMRNLILQLAFSILLYAPAYWNTQFPPPQQLIPLVFLAMCVGLFEAIFWRGWVQMRLEESFGVIPGILLASFFYALYHIGYSMPASEIVFLFFIGLMYAVTFRLTKSIFILYPFFQPLGQLKTLLNDQLTLPLISTLGFAEVWIGILLLLWLARRYQGKHHQPKVHFATQCNHR